MNINQVINIYSALGGVFVSNPSEIQARLATIKAFIFDWDGVFNGGRKGVGLHSNYSEGDSMGTNLMRFAHWLTQAKSLPYTGIITGANNETARAFAKREHFHFVYSGYKDKMEALAAFLDNSGLQASEVAFFFDDVLDLSVAKQCGLRFLVNREGSPLFKNYVTQQGWCDYISANNGEHYAIREITELLMALMGVYDEVIQKRMAYQGDYAEYLAERQAVPTMLFNHAEMKLGSGNV
ncbi:MAG: phosphatase [Flammeovirgaceae bacterium]